jgi:phosphoserine phosphatase
MSTGTERPLVRVSSAEIVSRLGGDAPKNAIIAFDADGTLWSGDIGLDTFEAMIAKRAVRKEALPGLNDEARAADLRLCDDPNDQVRVLHEAFEKGTYAEERAFTMMAWAFAGYLPQEVCDFASSVVESVGLQGRLHPEVLPVIDWAVKYDMPLYVVSASPELVVKTAIDLLHLPFQDVFAMTPAMEGGRIAPRILEPITYGAGKNAALQKGVPDATLWAAFGDSAFDVAMLRAARIRVAVRPKPGLVGQAGACPGLVELLRAP